MVRYIGILLYPDFQLLDAAGPIAAFEIAARMAGDAYALTLLSRGGGSVRSSSGVSLDTATIRDTGALDTLIVVGGNGSRNAMQCPDLLAFLRSRMEDTRRLCSVCSGAFLLAATGLLDGRRATTHWQRAEELSRLFPDVRVSPDAIHIQDGAVWTSAGISAGIDLALALIGEDLGDALSRRVAQQMVVFHRRPGGQSQFSALLEMGGGDGRFAELLGWMRSHLHSRLTIETLADRMAMSPRNFTRTFRLSVGMSSAKAVERLRLEAARERVEHSAIPIEVVAIETGFRDPERMRRAFLRAFGQPPQAMRRNASAT
ncbi:GlxA family transcriptional regulator [Gluconobacter sp. GP1]|uniref:GlxA family transcriptional regulator n=1 Tax=Gluconobacter sp. GP1 TaxID=3046423 RepID=UPI00293E8B18|nr:GlxA family transcriptional regulator [Gluconobacter sp. GP1]